MKIDLAEDLAEIEQIKFDDYPDQKGEYLVQRAVELSLQAVRKIAERMTELTEEEDLVEFRVAEAIMARIGGMISAQVLSVRLAERRPK